MLMIIIPLILVLLVNYTYNCLNYNSKRLDRGLKHECYSKFIHITAHLSLGIRLCGVRILVVRNLPVDPSAGLLVRILPMFT